MIKRMLCIVATALLAAPAAAMAVDIEVRPGASPSLRDATTQARPGDRILMRAGIHRGSDWLGPINGTAAAPITILSVDGPRAAVLEGGGGETLRIGDASSYLIIDGLEIRNSSDNCAHIDGNSHHVVFRNLFIHHCGQNGDGLKANQVHHITLERSEIAFPGRRDIQENPCQETWDFLDADDSIVRDNYFHDGCAMLSVLKGGSRRGIIERNIFDGRASTGSDPVVGVGGATDLPLLVGEQYEVIDVIFRNNIVYGGASGAIGIYDAQNAYLAHNLLVNNNRVLVEFRAGEGPAGGSTNVRFMNNVFLDTRGQMPPIFVRHSHTVAGLTTSYSTFWNNGSALPASPLYAVAGRTGHQVANPLIGLPAGAPYTYAGLVTAFRPGAGSPVYGTAGDASVSPYFVTNALGDLGGTLRLGQRDRGPYVLTTGSPPPPCTPTTCVAQGKNCGSIPDGCGGTLACGTCTAPAVCVSNVCSTVPAPLPICQLPSNTTPSTCSCVCTCQ